MRPIDNWDKVFNVILPKVAKPARYVGQERNAIVKDLNKVDISIALAFPDLYDVGMSYYGFQVLYHILNQKTILLPSESMLPGLILKSS